MKQRGGGERETNRGGEKTITPIQPNRGALRGYRERMGIEWGGGSGHQSAKRPNTIRFTAFIEPVQYSRVPLAGFSQVPPKCSAFRARSGDWARCAPYGGLCYLGRPETACKLCLSNPEGKKRRDRDALDRRTEQLSDRLQ